MAQCIHAAGESFGKTDPNSTVYAVALEARGSELHRVEYMLNEHGIPHRAIREPDPPYNGKLVAIGISPCERAIVYPLVKKLQLIR